MTASLYKDVINRDTTDLRHLHNDRQNIEKFSDIIHDTYHFVQGFEDHAHDGANKAKDIRYGEYNAIRSFEYVIDRPNSHAFNYLGGIIKDGDNIVHDRLERKDWFRRIREIHCLEINNTQYVTE